MKTRSVFLLIIILVTACAPQSVVAPLPAPAFTNTPLATATPEPSQIIEPTATPIPAVEISLDSCTQIVEAKISSVGVLEIVYENIYGNLSTWSEDTQAAVAFPLPQDGYGPKLSTDHRRIIFRRDGGENQSELWMIDAGGQNEEKLATIQYDNAQFLDYHWVPNTDKVFYYVGVSQEFGDPLYDKFGWIDVNSGRAISQTIPLESITYEFAPDGSQMAIRTQSELRVLSTQDGQVQFTIQASLNNPRYSLDGQYLFYFIDNGILRIDARDGQQHIIPLKYSTVIPRGGDGLIDSSPEFRWIGNTTLLVPLLDSDQRYMVQPMEPDPASWAFTVWQVDLASETTNPIRTFSGFQPSVIFSADNKRLAFYKFQGVAPSQTRALVIADLATGEILETIEGGVFEAWSPDSDEYIYSTSHPTKKGEVDNSKNYLGIIGGEPVPMNLSVEGSTWTVWWLDQNRLVMDCKILTIR